MIVMLPNVQYHKHSSIDDNVLVLIFSIGGEDRWLVLSLLHSGHCLLAGVVAGLHDQEQTTRIATFMD